jgi:hypothetical protein
MDVYLMVVAGVMIGFLLGYLTALDDNKNKFT